ncbi:DUF7260 family protein [Halobaculum magnesiiphilum]|uniref:DUF7260 domain-containing protein n=1 Tax=Halobaculum magnesiiphilum TaxID=1017351 RepID=A0A8T8WGM9_9EURY|nr:hypothetical protein [Halobaculum magnesiiphilum]QZP38894.1 hypothetical protein K6T50_07100 [Halobaculum magnesiiphilum]
MNGASRGVGRLSTEPVELGVESMCRAAACEHPDIAVGLAVLGMTAVFLLIAGAVLSRLDGAREALAREVTRTRAERDAFEQFRRRVAKLESSERARPTPTGGGTNVLTVPAGGATVDEDGLADARRAYRETVMATAHYEEEYDETLATNVAEEFSAPVASALVEDGGALTPSLRTTLASGARHASEERAELLSKLETERSSIEAAESTLSPAVDTSEGVVDRDLSRATYTDIVADYERLEWHEGRVESLLSDRQARIHDEEGDRRHWFDYLYRSLASPYPVLSAGAGTLSLIDDAKSALASAAGDR